MIVFTASDLKELNTQTPLSKDVPFDGDVSFIVTNISPAFFNVLDDLGKAQAIIPPWQIVQGNFNRNSLTLTVTVNYDLPLANSASASASQYALDVEVSNAATTPFSTQLPYANGVTQFSNVTNSSINVAGSVDANITNADLTITGGVNATVTNASLNVDVPNGVNVTNSSISVTPTPGSTIEVANTIDANLTGASVTIDTNTSILNEKLGVNPTILAMRASGQLTIPANGNHSYFNAIYDGLVGENITYDKLFLTLSSTKTDLSTISLMILDYYFHDPDMLIENVNLSLIPLSYSGGGNLNAIYEAVLPPLFPIGLVATQINNPTASAINDTFTLNVYGQYASQTVVNPTSSPVYNQDSVGSFDDFSGFNNDFTNSYPSATLFPSNSSQYIKKVILNIQPISFASGVFGLSFGIGNGARITVNVPPNSYDNIFLPLDFGSGIANVYGIDCGIDSAGSTGINVSVTGYVIYSTNLGQPVPATII